MPAVPEVIELPEPNAMSLDVSDRALFVVDNVLLAAKVKSPVPSSSESESKLVVPLVVRFEESVTPFSAFTVRPWKVESEFSKVTEDPEAVAFNVTFAMEVVTPSTVIFPFDPSPMMRLPAVIFPSPEEVRLTPQVPPQLDAPRPIVAPDKEARIVVLAVPLLRVLLRARPPAVREIALFPALNAEARVKVPDPSLSVSESKVVVPADVKLSLIVMPVVALRVTAPAADIPPVVAFNVIEPADAVSDAPEAREMLSSESAELLESPSRVKFPAAERVLLSMANPFAPDNVRAPCPVIVPPLWPTVNFPEELKLEPAAKVMAPFTRLRSPVPVIFASSVLVRFIPNPELKPIPKEPLSATFMVVEPVPLLSVPVKIRSSAVTVSALLVVDKEPDEMVKSPEPLLSRSASITVAPLVVTLVARVIPELALNVAAPAVVIVLLTVILPFEESVNAPFAVIEPVEAPRVMLPADEVMVVPLARVSALPPSRLTLPELVSVLLLSVKPLLAVIATDPDEVTALPTLIVEPVEVRARFPEEEMLLELSVKAPAELKVTLPNDNADEFALIFKLPEEVEIPLFKVIPEFAVNATAPAPVRAPVIVRPEVADRVNAPAAVISPVVALREISPALVKVIPLANIM